MRTATEAKPYLSPSQLETYCRCPEQYRRRYIEGEIIPPGIAILKGKGFHVGAETNMRQKIDSHEDLPASEIVDAAVSGFETEAAGGYLLTADESESDVGQAKDSLAAMAECHAEQQAPDYQPVLVEQRVRIELPGARDLLGIVDLADDLGRVTDFKTAGRKKRQEDADTSVQLTTYAAAYHAVRGEPPKSLRLDSVVQTRAGKTYRDLLETQRSEPDLIALANRINAIASGVEAGNFPPTTPGAWWCSPRWCGYWATCSYVNSERQGLVQLNED